MSIIPLWAHRGYSGRYPENTMAAFIAAVEAGADGIECDVHQTLDGHFVLMHDAKVQRTTNGRGRIAQMTLAQLETLDAGAWFQPAFAGTRVPQLAALAAYLAQYQRPVTLNLEWKTPLRERAIVEAALRLIAVYQLSDRVLHSSFDVENLRVLKRVNLGAHTALLAKRGDANAIELARQIDADAVHPDYLDITPRYVKRAHATELSVHPYTVNDKKSFAWMTECAVDAVITDWPAAHWLISAGDDFYPGF